MAKTTSQATLDAVKHYRRWVNSWVGQATIRGTAAKFGIAPSTLVRALKRRATTTKEQK